MDSKSTTISVAEYISAAVSVAEASGCVMRKVYESGNLQQKDKEFPVTLADLLVQKSIEDNFNHFFPTLACIGEESDKSTDNLDTDIESVKQSAVNLDFIKIDQLNKNLEIRKPFNQYMNKACYGNEILSNFDTFETKNACVWIDPLDGTSDFVSGNLSAVTILIGLAIEGVPKIGIVHHPFKQNANDGVGFTIFGTQEHGAYYLEYDSKKSAQELANRTPEYMPPFNYTEVMPEDYKIKVACSLSHFNQQMQNTLDLMDPVEICRIGGAGNKVNRIALGECDSYVQPRGGLKFWDLCAPEGIVRAMGGVCQGFDGNRTNYSKNAKTVVLPAFSASKTLNMQTMVFRRLKSVVKL